MSLQKEILIFETPFTLTNQLVKTFVEIGQAAIAQNGRFAVALSGGRSPIEFFCRLSSLKDFDFWRKTYLFVVDERAVALDHSDSNFLTIKENLLQYVPIPWSNVFPVPVNPADLKTTAEIYERNIRDFFRVKENQVPSFDLILLGVGEDGHTASLFPGDPALDENKKLVTSVQNGKIRPARITLTFPVLNQAQEVIFVAMGQFKADVIKRILEDREDLPAGRVHSKKGKVTFFLDKNVAKKLDHQNKFVHKDEAISFVR